MSLDYRQYNILTVAMSREKRHDINKLNDTLLETRNRLKTC